MRSLFFLAMLLHSVCCAVEQLSADEYYTLESGNDSDPVNLLIKYKNENGRSDVNKLGKIKMEISRLGIASVATTRRSWRSVVSNPNIEYVEPDYEMYAIDLLRSPQKESFLRSGGQRGEKEEQEHRELTQIRPYGINMVKAREVPVIPAGNEKIKVCVVDTGYNLGHPDLPNRNNHNVNGFKPSSYSGSWSVDPNGHGTHVAGTIGAIGTNTIGVDSVLSNPFRFEFFIGKGINDEGGGDSSAIMEAMEACRSAGAKIINLSLGGRRTSQAFIDLSKSFFDDGILMIAAAGNRGDSSYLYPASYPHLMSVASVNREGVKSTFSQFNDQVEIAAPGSGVYSTYPTNTYSTLSGTSMATPHVVGVAALVWAHFPECSNLQIRNVLLRSATDAGPPGCDAQYGYGIVNAKAAYDLLAVEGCRAGGVNPTVLSNGSKGGCMQEVPSGPPAPGPAPGPCSGTGKTPFRMELLTDDYPEESSLQLTGSSGNIVFNRGNFALQNNRYEFTVCLVDGAYTFTINDSFEDGICCEYGEGMYRIFLGGELIGSGSQFGGSESKSFAVGRGGGGGTNPCSNNGESTFRLELTPDDYPEEISFELVNSEGSVISSGGPFGTPNEDGDDDDGSDGEGVIIATACLRRGTYTFIIYDSYGDGLCCSYGNGSYEIFVNGLLVGSGASFSSNDSKRFTIN